MNAAKANLHPRQGRIQFIQAIICHKLMLEIESFSLGNGLIYSYDQNSFARRKKKKKKKRFQPIKLQ